MSQQQGVRPVTEQSAMPGLYVVNGINGVGMISDAVAESDLITKYLPAGSIIVDPTL